MKIGLAGDCKNEHHSLYNMYMYMRIYIYKYHNLILNILTINDNNLFWLLALLLLLCLLLTLVLFLLLMINTTTLAMIKIIDTQTSKHQPKCSRRVRRVARLHNCWGRPTPKTTRIHSIMPTTIEFKQACSMSPRLRSSIGFFINSSYPAGMDKFHLSAVCFGNTLAGSISKQLTLVDAFLPRSPPIRVSFFLAS